jgi:F5/8 type C domain
MALSPGKVKLAAAALALLLTAARARQNLALHRPATSSSARFGHPSALVNGVIEWGTFALHTQPDRPAWFKVDLEGTHPIGEVRVFGRGDGFIRDDVPPMPVELSLDGQTWKQVGACEGLFTQASPCRVYPGGAPARYVRLTYPYLVLSEVEVYEAR